MDTQEKINETKRVQELLNTIEKEKSKLQNNVQQQNNYLQQITQQIKLKKIKYNMLA
jgi:hypothetical protein